MVPVDSYRRHRRPLPLRVDERGDQRADQWHSARARNQRRVHARVRRGAASPGFRARAGVRLARGDGRDGGCVARQPARSAERRRRRRLPLSLREAERRARRFTGFVMAMKTYVLEREQVIERSRAETFAFFGDAFNLERITPRFLGFRILTAPPIHMAAGTLIEYRLSLFAVGFRWKTLIEEWTPDTSFADTQLDGPYALWQHTHSFEAIDANRTGVRDRVLYRLPFGIFGRIAHTLFVRRTLEKIFSYRADVIARLLAPDTRRDEATSDTD